MRTRKRFSAEFKAKVALDAVKSHERRLRNWRGGMSPDLSPVLDAVIILADAIATSRK